MKIWKLSAALNDYVILEDVKDCSLEEIRSFDGRSKAKNWEPMEVKRSEDSINRPLSDFPGFILMPVFSDKALKVLKDLVKDNVETLRLKFDEGEYFAINITKVLNILDYQRAKYKTFRDGKRIMRIEKYVFKACEDLEACHIFRLFDEKRGDPFVSDAFKKAVEENGLTGFRFELAWDSEEAENAHEETKDEHSEVQDDGAEEGCFSYVGDLDAQVMEEINRTIETAMKTFRISSKDDGERMAAKIYEATEEILKKGKLPKGYEDLDDVACALGCLFGQALVRGYGWKWKEVGPSREDAIYCVVSPNENWVNPCMVYLQKILRGENDNTLLLLYHVIGEQMKKVSAKLSVLW